MRAIVALGLLRCAGPLLAAAWFCTAVAQGTDDRIQSSASPPVAAPAAVGNPSTPETRRLPAAQQARLRADAINRLLSDGKKIEALLEAQMAIARYPRDAQLRFLHALALAQNRRDTEAEAAFEALTRDFPELAEPHNNLAALYAARGDLDRAQASLQRALQARPDYSLANENLGDVYLRMAIRAYQRASDAKPPAPDASRKLRLARDLVAKIAPGGAARP
ncbi:MAG: tetratricopeptide repeat protein [Burkholderiaceae bacterium]|nr:tetratricopeptide repeat protein [Burkholderiaceae bacterium]